MKTLLYLLFALIPVLGFAQTELETLRSKYDTAVQTAVAPINKKYEKELTSLLEKSAKAKDFKTMELIRQELEKIKVSVPSTSNEDESLVDSFIAKKWKTPSGTTFSFSKDGTGFRQFGNDKTELIWKKISDNMIEAVGKNTSTGNIRSWYFQIIDKNNVKSGATKEVLDISMIKL